MYASTVTLILPGKEKGLFVLGQRWYFNNEILLPTQVGVRMTVSRQCRADGSCYTEVSLGSGLHGKDGGATGHEWSAINC